MISITLGPEPEILARNSIAWGQEYAQALESGDAEKPERYRRDDIRDALRDETHRKCAYCESLFEHVTFAHIEHILPKSKVPLLVCTWSNLTLACPCCNSNKGSYYDEEAPLLNPYTDNPDAQITFFGPMAIDRSDKAKLTIAKLKLNRSGLVYKRLEKLREALRIMDLIMMSDHNQALKNALTEDLRGMLLPEAEHINCIRCFILDEAPHRGVEESHLC